MDGNHVFDQGGIVFPRSILSKFEKVTKKDGKIKVNSRELGCFIDLVKRTQYQTRINEKTAQVLERGKCYFSKERLAKIWGVNEKTVDRYFSRWEKEGLISYPKGMKNGTVTTIIDFEARFTYAGVAKYLKQRNSTG